MAHIKPTGKILFSLLLLFSFFFQQAKAQQGCTLVNSIIINTGYNPTTGAAIGTGQQDQNWIVSAITPAMQLIPGANASLNQGAFAINAHPLWINNNNTSQYISFTTANFFATQQTNNVHSVTFTRSFRTCVADTYQFSLNVSDDNLVTALTVDGGASQLNQAVVNNFAAFAPVTFTQFLNPGLHNLSITVQNWTAQQPEPQNFFGLNVFGTITGNTNSIASPACLNVCPAPNCSDTCYWKVTGNNIINGNNIFGTLTNNDIRVFSNNTQRGVIRANGNFGWRTSNPSTLFHIDCANPSGVPSNLRFENLSAGNGSPLVVDANGYVHRGRSVVNPGLTNNCGSLNFVTKTGNPGFLECSQIYDDGTFVGIATTFPAFVNGTMSTLNVNGLTVSNSFYAVSDGKYKRNIESIKNATAIINQLRGVTYSWDQQSYPDRRFEEATQAGFIAQEVKNIYPIAVANNGKDGYLVNYNSFIPLLTRGQQELNIKLDELSAQNKVLQLEIAELKNQLNSKRVGDIGNKITQPNILYQNRPNPFSSSTTIDYSISAMKSDAFIIVYDLTGKELIRLRVASIGKGSVQIDANKLVNGIYLYSLVVDGAECDTRKMTILGN